MIGFQTRIGRSDNEGRLSWVNGPLVEEERDAEAFVKNLEEYFKKHGLGDLRDHADYHKIAFEPMTHQVFLDKYPELNSDREIAKLEKQIAELEARVRKLR